MVNNLQKTRTQVFNDNFIRSENNILAVIQMAFALLVIAWMNNGLFTYIMPYVPNYIRYGLYFMWLGFAIVTKKEFIGFLFVEVCPLLLFYFYIIFVYLFTDASLITYIKSITYLIIIYSIFLYYFNGENRRFQKILCGLLILDFIAVGINTHFQLKINPLMARYLATGTDTREMLLGNETFHGIGSYGYSYSLVAIILLLIFLFLNQSKRKFLLFLSIVLSLTLLIQFAFTIAIMFTLFYIVVLLIIKNKNSTVVMGFLVIILFLIFLNMDYFASILTLFAEIQVIPYEVSVRLIELSDLFSGYDIFGTDLYSRQSLYLQSLDAFLNHVFIGTLSYDNIIYAAGGHSAWLDLLATFGLCSTPFFIFLYKAYKYCIKGVPVAFRTFVNVYWLYFVSLGFINTLLFAPIFTVWFLFLPVFINECFNEENTNYHELQSSNDIV